MELRGKEGSDAFLDRDYFETITGYIFCVVGEQHPKDRVTSYLKYIPTRDQTLWSRDSINYYRIMKTYGASQYENVMKYLEHTCREYVRYDPYMNIKLIQVPIRDIKIHYKPEVRILEILKEPKDKLEHICKDIIQILSDYSNVNVEYFGITGSLLLKIHNIEKSDIDILVYSKKNVYKILDAIDYLIEKDYIKFNKDVVEMCVRDVSKYLRGLDYEYLVYIVKRRRGRLMFRDKIFSINFVRTFYERYERYGEYIYYKLYPVKFKAKVVDISESYFNPAVYIIDDVRPIDPLNIPNVSEVVCFENIFSGIVKENEEVVVYGMLERKISTLTGEVSYRVVVGSIELKGFDYILPTS